jgi:pyruvate formate lyase activating enzyme
MSIQQSQETRGETAAAGQPAPGSAALRFRGLITFTMVDFPGRLAMTAYTMGCNFRCPICHNRELALSLADRLPEYDVDAVLDAVRERDGWIEGICVTGGEPLLHAGTASALGRFKGEGLAVKLDTNGCFPDRLKELLDAGLVDYVAMDVKAPLTDEEYSKAAGVGAARWLPRLSSSMEIIKRSGVDHEFRTICLPVRAGNARTQTGVPGFHSPEAIGRIARTIAPCRKYVLRAFRPVNTLDPEYEKVPAPTDDQMRAFLEAAREYVPGAVVD